MRMVVERRDGGDQSLRSNGVGQSKCGAGCLTAKNIVVQERP